jgi:hypothetical protein
MVTKIIDWVFIPALLIVALFSCIAGRYEWLLDFLVCMSAVTFVARAVLLRDYFGAAGFLTVLIVFSPLLLESKIFLLMAFTSVAIVMTLCAAFRRQTGRGSL